MSLRKYSICCIINTYIATIALYSSSRNFDKIHYTSDEPREQGEFMQVCQIS